MSLSTKVDALAARIAVAVKALRDDPRWIDARTPKPHASSHAANGSDPITPAAIGAATDTAVVHTSGNETINGTKIFGSPPQVPAGTQLTHPVRRDDARLTDARPPAAELANVAGGWLQLDGAVKVPQNLLPAVAIVDFLGAVASQAAMLALSGQRGDWCTRTDRGTDYQLIADNPALLGSWREITYPGSPVASVNGRTGAVTGLAEQTDLDAKQDLAARGAANGYAPLDANSRVPTANVYAASTTQRGVVQLAGDLAGTSTAPTVPGLADKAEVAAGVPLGGAVGEVVTKTGAGDHADGWAPQAGRVIARGRRTTSSTATSTSTATAAQGVQRLTAALKAGRRYRIGSFDAGVYGSATEGRIALQLTYTTATGTPAVPTASSTLLKFTQQATPASQGVVACPIVGFYDCPSDQNFTVLLSIYAGGIAGTYQTFGATTWPLNLIIEDVGPIVADTGVNV